MPSDRRPPVPAAFGDSISNSRSVGRGRIVVEIGNRTPKLDVEPTGLIGHNLTINIKYGVLLLAYFTCSSIEVLTTGGPSFHNYLFEGSNSTIIDHEERRIRYTPLCFLVPTSFISELAYYTIIE